MDDVTPVGPRYCFKELFGVTNPYSRQRYWAVMVALFGFNILLGLVSGVVSTVFPPAFFVTFAVGLACGWIVFASTLKRLRDADVSLWWVMLNFVPVLNLISLIVFGCIGSSALKNERSAKPVVITFILVGLVVLTLPMLIIASVGYMLINKAGGHGAVTRTEYVREVRDVSGTEMISETVAVTTTEVSATGAQ